MVHGRRQLCPAAVLWLGCILHPLSAQIIQTSATMEAPLRFASSLDTEAPAFDFLSLMRSDIHRVSWSGNATIAIEKSGTQHPIVHAFDRDGRDSPVVIDIEGASVIRVDAAAQGRDRSLGAVGYTFDSAGHRSGFFYLASTDRQTVKVVRMSGLYLPQAIAMASDGSIWVKGCEPGEMQYQINLDAPVIRRISRDGSSKIHS